MTKNTVITMTVISTALYVFFHIAFADGAFALDNLISSDYYYAESTLLTYLLGAFIIIAGYLQWSRVPENGVRNARRTQAKREVLYEVPGEVEDPIIWKRLLNNVYWSQIWLSVRFFVGLQWLHAGAHKIDDPAWGTSGHALVNPDPEIMGFWERIAMIPEPPARPAIGYGWYRDFIQYMIDNGWESWFAPLIAWGELLIGLGLIVGALVGIAAFFGTLMNFSFMLAGTASSNPVLFGLAVFLILAWKVAGYWGLDRWLLPILGTPWGLFQRKRHPMEDQPAV